MTDRHQPGELGRSQGGCSGHSPVRFGFRLLQVAALDCQDYLKSRPGPARAPRGATAHCPTRPKGLKRQASCFTFNTKHSFCRQFIHAQSKKSYNHLLPGDLNAVFFSAMYRYTAEAPVDLLLEIQSLANLNLPTPNNLIFASRSTKSIRQGEAECNHKRKPAKRKKHISIIIAHLEHPSLVRKKINSPLKNTQHNRSVRESANSPDTHPLSNVHRRGNRARSPEQRHRTLYERHRSCGVPLRVCVAGGDEEEVD